MPEDYTMDQDPKQSSASTVTQTAETLQSPIKNDMPPETAHIDDTKVSDIEKLRQKMSPLLLYVVSTAQFLDIG